MNLLKSVFISAYVIFIVIGTIMSIYGLSNNYGHVGWFAAVVIFLIQLGWFSYIYLGNPTETSITTTLISAAVGAGALITLGKYGFEDKTETLPVIFGVSSFLGWMVYHQIITRYIKYSGLTNQQMGELQFSNSDGKPIKIKDITGKKLLVFHRGNWCPFCMSQLKSLNEQTEQLKEYDITVVAVSPQNEKLNQNLARNLDAPFVFAQDVEYRVSKELNLYDPHGTPFGFDLLGFTRHSIRPITFLIGDNNQVIGEFATKDYRRRPDLEFFLRYLNQ